MEIENHGNVPLFWCMRWMLGSRTHQRITLSNIYIYCSRSELVFTLCSWLFLPVTHANELGSGTNVELMNNVSEKFQAIGTLIINFSNFDGILCNIWHWKYNMFKCSKTAAGHFNTGQWPVNSWNSWFSPVVMKTKNRNHSVNKVKNLGNNKWLI